MCREKSMSDATTAQEALTKLDVRLSELANRYMGTLKNYYLHGLWMAREEIKALRDSLPKEDTPVQSTEQEPAGETPRTDAYYAELRSWVEYCKQYPNMTPEQYEQCPLECDEEEFAKRLERELAAVKEKQTWRNKHDPVTRLHNLCDGLRWEKEESPYGVKAWDDLQVENDSLRKELAAVKADLAKAISNHAADLSIKPARDAEERNKLREDE